MSIQNPFRGPSRREWVILALLACYFVVPAYLLRDWWIEDSAIAFSYARNLAHGNGLVPFAGGERAEGYSDPLWVLILAGVQLVGLYPYLWSKVIGGLFAAACVPLVWGIARRVPGAGPRAPMMAAALVATNPLLGIWANSGLENSLFSMLLAAGVLRMLVEGDAADLGRRLRPYSSLLFLGVALTRTEGIVYAAFGAGVGALGDLRRQSLGRAVVRMLVLFVPWVGYELARYAYFALPFPLPYYAKLADETFDVKNWKTRGWMGLRGWALQCGMGFLFFVPVLGITRGRGIRALAVLGAVLGAAVLKAGTVPEHTCVAIVSALALSLPFLALPNGPARLVLAGLGTITLAFSILSNGDWMAGFRWYSLLVIPLTVLYAVGIGAIAARFSRRWAGLLTGALFSAQLIWNLCFIGIYAKAPESMTPFTTKGRVDAFKDIAQKIHLDRPWIAVDHAMGGHMWFAPPDGMTLDWYGLTDETFALHRPVHGFAGQFLLHPATFDFAHMDAGFRFEKAFNDQFVETPKTKGRTKDDFIHRTLLTTPAWPGPPHVVTWSDGHRLEGVSVPAPKVRPGGAVYMELGLSRTAADNGDFDVSVVLSGPDTVSFSASPGYEGLFPPGLWHEGEIFCGKYAFDLPATLPLGTYSLTVGVTTPKGAPAIVSGDPVYADVVTVVSQADAKANDEANWERGLAAAGKGDCEAAESAWLEALHGEPKNLQWARELSRRAATPYADCWAGHVAGEPDVAAQLEDLRRARRWDPTSPSATAAGVAVADALEPSAAEARAAGKLEDALQRYDDVVRADPTRAWARRYAEDARSELLRLHPPKPPPNGPKPATTAPAKSATVAPGKSATSAPKPVVAPAGEPAVTDPAVSDPNEPSDPNSDRPN